MSPHTGHGPQFVPSKCFRYLGPLQVGQYSSFDRFNHVTYSPPRLPSLSNDVRTDILSGLFTALVDERNSLREILEEPLVESHTILGRRVEGWSSVSSVCPRPLRWPDSLPANRADYHSFFTSFSTRRIPTPGTSSRLNSTSPSLLSSRRASTTCVALPGIRPLEGSVAYLTRSD